MIQQSDESKASQAKRAERTDDALFDDAEAHVVGTLSLLPRVAVVQLAREVVDQLAQSMPSASARLHGPDPDETDALCDALLSPDKIAARDFVRGLRDDGVPVEDIYLEFLAPAAARLGERWQQDKLSFTEVGLAVSRLYTMVVALRTLVPPKGTSPERRAVFATVPGENHTLGVTMAADIFTRAGWDITLLTQRDHEALVQDITDTGVVLIGLSAGTRRSLVALLRLIVALRVARPSCRILISGQVTHLGVDLVGAAGVDAVAEDIESALAEMERLSRAFELRTASA